MQTSNDKSTKDLVTSLLQQSKLLEPDRTLGFGTHAEFTSGLSSIIGEPPQTSLFEALEREHTASNDSNSSFTIERIGMTTTSRTEWYYITQGTADSLVSLNLKEWPIETNIETAPENFHRRGLPKTLEMHEVIRRDINQRLRDIDHVNAQHLTREEYLAATLYTGPMGLKYQRGLRAVALGDRPGHAWRKNWLSEDCKGNFYPTTIHLIHSAVQKMSRLVSVGIVYSGVSGLPLDNSFMEPDAVGARGGLEHAFTATTTDRDVAISYATPRFCHNIHVQFGIVFEIHMGPLDRGGDLSLLSQYPHEHEIVLPPFTFQEFEDARVDETHPWLLVVRTRCRVQASALKDLLVNSEQRETLVEIVRTAREKKINEAVRNTSSSGSSGSSGSSNSSSSSSAVNPSFKFSGDIRTFVTGEAAEAARGLVQYMDVKDENTLRLKMRSLGVGAIIEEVDASGIVELKNQLEYVLNQPATEMMLSNGMRDSGRNGETIDDFVNHSIAKQCSLDKAQVVALRLYTTAAYKFINDPLRSDQKTPHPLPATVLFLSEGLKKLRVRRAEAVAKESKSEGSGGSGSLLSSGGSLWRGIKDLSVDGEFMKNCQGGTELAPMSTTTDIAVAAMYAVSSHCLMFKIRAGNFMQWGADLQWLSAFPNESEICFPPLTYLQPSGRIERFRVAEDVEFTIVEVTPFF